MAIIAKARSMRKTMSPPEARLWVAVRRLRARGFHFRRQHPMLGYYLDFVCLDRGLIVEELQAAVPTRPLRGPPPPAGEGEV